MPFVRKPLKARTVLLRRHRRAAPRRQALPEHLRRVEHRHEPEDATCPSEGCGRPMACIGEDISEQLDIVPAEFFVHSHVYGKWACRCCQTLKQPTAALEMIDGGMAASGLLAHTLISRFADHLPYYRQEAINARAGVHTPRSTLAVWPGQAGPALEPLYDAHKRFVLNSRGLHADEIPVALLDPGAGKTRKAYVWAYARSQHDPKPGVVYDFCTGRGPQYPRAFLAGDERAGLPAWQGTLLTDRYGAYDTVLDERLQPGSRAAACVAHARRNSTGIFRASTSQMLEPAQDPGQNTLSATAMRAAFNLRWLTTCLPNGQACADRERFCVVRVEIAAPSVSPLHFPLGRHGGDVLPS